MVTAETAVVVPSLVVLLAIALWAVMVGAYQVRIVEASRAGARAAARGESAEAVADRVRAAAGPHAEVDVTEDGDEVVVEVERTVHAPWPVLRRLLPELTLRSRAVAPAEESP